MNMVCIAVTALSAVFDSIGKAQNAGLLGKFWNDKLETVKQESKEVLKDRAQRGLEKAWNKLYSKKAGDEKDAGKCADKETAKAALSVSSGRRGRRSPLPLSEHLGNPY